MGMIFGKIGVETPQFKVMEKLHGMEIRQYPQALMVTCSSKDFPEAKTAKEFENMAFRVLAGYIGVMGSPQNEGSRSIPMTAPVVSHSSGQQIPMTAPVVSQSEGLDWTESFILPHSMQEAPKPNDPRIKIEVIPKRTFAVRTFSGFCGKERAQEIAQDMILYLKEHEINRYQVAQTKDGEDEWQLFRYNPPFTFPCLRTNEVAIVVSPNASLTTQ